MLDNPRRTMGNMRNILFEAYFFSIFEKGLCKNTQRTSRFSNNEPRYGERIHHLSELMKLDSTSVAWNIARTAEAHRIHFVNMTWVWLQISIPSDLQVQQWKLGGIKSMHLLDRRRQMRCGNPKKRMSLYSWFRMTESSSSQTSQMRSGLRWRLVFWLFRSVLHVRPPDSESVRRTFSVVKNKNRIDHRIPLLNEDCLTRSSHFFLFHLAPFTNKNDLTQTQVVTWFWGLLSTLYNS